MAKRKEANTDIEAVVKAYTPKPSVKEEAVKYLKSKGYKVEFKDGFIQGLFSGDDKFKQCRKLLVEKFSDGKSLPFSFGGRVGDISSLIKTEQDIKSIVEEEEYSTEEHTEYSK